MIFDPIANMISAIKNGYLSKRAEVIVPFSSYKQQIVKVLMEEKFLSGQEEKVDSKTKKKVLVLKLKYENKRPAISDIKQVSKAGLRVYVPYTKIPKVLGGLGISVLSTPTGVVSSRKAKKIHTGGEVICRIW